jgi:hypothetical protein
MASAASCDILATGSRDNEIEPQDVLESWQFFQLIGHLIDSKNGHWGAPKA